MLQIKNSTLIIIFLALTLRLAGIASRPIWYDEAFSILLAEQGPSTILAGTLSVDTDASSAEEHPPGYYFTLWAWIKLFGNSVTSARTASVLAGVGTMGFVYLIAKQVFNESTAQAAAILMAAIPFQVHYSQEIRMYAFLALWLSAVTYFYIKKQWILFAVFAALSQYTHNLAAIYLIPIALTPLIQRDWKTLRSVTLAGFSAIILYSPWLIQLPNQLAKVSNNFWVEKPGLERIFTLLLYYVTNLPLPGLWLIPGLLLSTLVITLAFYQTYTAFKQKLPDANSSLWFLYLSFAPPILLWLVSQIQPIYIERALLPSHAMFCIWLAWAFTQAKMPKPVKLFGLALILMSMGMGLYQHISYTGFPYGPYANLNERIKNEFQAGDVIIHSSKLSYLPSFYFDRDLAGGFVIDPPGSNVDTLSPATRNILHLKDYETIDDASANASRIWFVIYQQSIDEFASQENSIHPHLQYLDDHFTLEKTENWQDLRLYLYIGKTP